MRDVRISALGLVPTSSKRPILFFLRLMTLVGQHVIFGAAGTAAFLAADFFGELLGGGFDAVDLLLNFLGQESPGEKPIDRLGAVFLAFDRKAGRAMQQEDAG